MIYDTATGEFDCVPFLLSRFSSSHAVLTLDPCPVTTTNFQGRTFLQTTTLPTPILTTTTTSGQFPLHPTTDYSP